MWTSFCFVIASMSAGVPKWSVSTKAWHIQVRDVAILTTRFSTCQKPYTCGKLLSPKCTNWQKPEIVSAGLDHRYQQHDLHLLRISVPLTMALSWSRSTINSSSSEVLLSWKMLIYLGCSIPEKFFSSTSYCTMVMPWVLASLCDSILSSAVDDTIKIPASARRTLVRIVFACLIPEMT